MFDTDIAHYLTDRTVDGAHQVYIGIDNKTGKPALAIPGVEHALVGAYYYELSQKEYEEARKNLSSWYEKNQNKSQFQKAA